MPCSENPLSITITITITIISSQVHVRQERRGTFPHVPSCPDPEWTVLLSWLLGFRAIIRPPGYP